MASLCLLETSYFILVQEDRSFKTLRDNERAKKLNTHLGYELQEGQEEVYNQVYVMTAASFRLHAPKLIKAAKLLAGMILKAILFSLTWKISGRAWRILSTGRLKRR